MSKKKKNILNIDIRWLFSKPFNFCNNHSLILTVIIITRIINYYHDDDDDDNIEDDDDNYYYLHKIQRLKDGAAIKL